MQLAPGIIPGTHYICQDIFIVKVAAKKMGQNPQVLKKMLYDNEHNKYTTLYHLYQKQHLRGELHVAPEDFPITKTFRTMNSLGKLNSPDEPIIKNPKMPTRCEMYAPNDNTLEVKRDNVRAMYSNAQLPPSKVDGQLPEDYGNVKRSVSFNFDKKKLGVGIGMAILEYNNQKRKSKHIHAELRRKLSICPEKDRNFEEYRKRIEDGIGKQKKIVKIKSNKASIENLNVDKKNQNKLNTSRDDDRKLEDMMVTSRGGSVEKNLEVNVNMNYQNGLSQKADKNDNSYHFQSKKEKPVDRKEELQPIKEEENNQDQTSYIKDKNSKIQIEGATNTPVKQSKFTSVKPNKFTPVKPKRTSGEIYKTYDEAYKDEIVNAPDQVESFLPEIYECQNHLTDRVRRSSVKGYFVSNIQSVQNPGELTDRPTTILRENQSILHQNPQKKMNALLNENQSKPNSLKMIPKKHQLRIIQNKYRYQKRISDVEDSTKLDEYELHFMRRMKSRKPSALGDIQGKQVVMSRQNSFNQSKDCNKSKEGGSEDPNKSKHYPGPSNQITKTEMPGITMNHGIPNKLIGLNKSVDIDNTRRRRTVNFDTKNSKRRLSVNKSVDTNYSGRRKSVNKSVDTNNSGRSYGQKDNEENMVRVEY